MVLEYAIDVGHRGYLSSSDDPEYWGGQEVILSRPVFDPLEIKGVDYATIH